MFAMFLRVLIVVSFAFIFWFNSVCTLDIGSRCIVGSVESIMACVLRSFRAFFMPSGVDCSRLMYWVVDSLSVFSCRDEMVVFLTVILIALASNCFEIHCY